MKIIDSAELVRYNANSRGTNTGDCSIRAISLAFHRDYNDIRKLLKSGQERTRCSKYNQSKNIMYVVSILLGAGRYTDIESERLTVDAFAERFNSGTYLVGCCRKPEPKWTGDYLGGHIVTIINGKVIDTWDSRKYYVCKYWKIKNSPEYSNTDTQLVTLGTALTEWTKQSKEWWNNEIRDSFEESVARSRRLTKILDDPGIDVNLGVIMNKCCYSSFIFKVYLKFEYDIPEFDIEDSYIKVIKIAVKPDTQPDNIESYIKSIFDVKMNDNVWELGKKVEGVIQGYRESADLPEGSFHGLYMDDRERRIFNTLPYWIKKITNNFEIYGRNTGYWNNYRLRISVQELPNDTSPQTSSSWRNSRTFEADSKDELLSMLEEYRRTGDYYSARYMY